MKPKIIKNFASDQELQELNNWCINNHKNRLLFRDANMGEKNTRLTTRYSDNIKFSFPEVATSVRQRIIDQLVITDYKTPPFHDGIVCGIGFEGGTIYEHLDPVWHDNTYTLHCNIISQKSLSGGTTIIDGTEYETEPNDLLCYPVSELKHSVTEIHGSVPRILWVFGFSVPKNFTVGES